MGSENPGGRITSTIERRKQPLSARQRRSPASCPTRQSKHRRARHRRILRARAAGRCRRAKPRNLYGAALSLWRFAERRRPGQAKIRVHNPDPAADGWSSPHTIVEIVNDDMPFLVDSVTGAINASNRVVHLVIHPILTVARDPDGRLCEILAPSAAGTARIVDADRDHARIGSGRPRAADADLVGCPRRCSRSGRGLAADAPGACARLSAELSRSRRPRFPPAELAEGQDFLRWLDDDNFTFLGFREYVFDGAAKPERGPLGILRDEAHPVFGGLRDLSSLPSDVQDFVRRRELLVITKSNRRATVHRTAHMDAIGVRRFGADGEVVGIRLFLGLFTSLAYSRSSALDPAAAAQGPADRRARRPVAGQP